MNPVIQEEKTGCGIASSAAIAGISYHEAKKIANSIGIIADDQSLWSDPQHVRNLLSELGINTDKSETPFKDWETLPDCALLSSKWHIENSKPYWHWVVFVREGSKQYVLDSKKALKNNIRTDFGRIKPKWYIKVYV
ncbi:MAG: hypothetical protein OEY52_14125 [Gammaproteobacteria bacterium]|nr:hypothetical protein [Gammaproteobacteria bacterium]